MSNPSERTLVDCDRKESGEGLELIVEARTRELGGVTVRRVLPTMHRRMVGPWIFFDHMGPTVFTAGEGIDVAPHPHINLATVTYLFDGELLHRDALGTHQVIRPGAVNMMVSGSGLAHSERERAEHRMRPHTLHGLQLWLALPEADEEIEPAFYHYGADALPTVDVDGVAVRVLIGEAYGARSPVRTYAQTLYVEATLGAGQQLVVPEAPERAVYVVSGTVRVDGQSLAQHHLGVLRPGTSPCLAASVDSRVAIIGGATFAKRFIEWNFVSSRRDRIERAKSDWREGRFAKVPGDEIEFIPLPGEG